MSETADVVVVGGGIVGVSAAYHLASAGAGRVLLLERADALGTGSTGACAGGFRYQFSSDVNVRLSLASVPMILGFEEEHGIAIDTWQDGYLFLVRGEDAWHGFVRAADHQRSNMAFHSQTPRLPSAWHFHRKGRQDDAEVGCVRVQHWDSH